MTTETTNTTETQSLTELPVTPAPRRRTVRSRIAVVVVTTIALLAGACSEGTTEPHAGVRVVAEERTGEPAASSPSNGPDRTVSTDVDRTPRSVTPGERTVEPQASGATPMLSPREQWDDGTSTVYTDYEWYSMEEFMTYVLYEIDIYWTGVFAANGLAEPWVYYYFPYPGEWSYSWCTDAQGNPSIIDDSALFYCPASDRIVVSQQAAWDIYSGEMTGPDGQNAGGVIGDFAVAMILAHEYAHQIQDEFGVLGYYDTPTLEKHADCLSGVWTAAAESAGILDEGDVEEGFTAAWLVGDSYFDSPDHHGTSEQRMQAFGEGYEGGSPASCDHYVPLGIV